MRSVMFLGVGISPPIEVGAGCFLGKEKGAAR